MNHEERNPRAWAATLGAGLVVEIAVWGLLEWLRRTVDDVEEAVEAVWTTGKQVAQNTQASHVLGGTSAAAAELARALDRTESPRGEPT
jgi:hypothetical protein